MRVLVMMVYDDSEPILGLWFEETLAPPETPSGNQNAQTNDENVEGNGKQQSRRAGSIVPEKGEPDGVSYFNFGSV
ncbi:hypothetical protein PR048_022958 [Dryococelus australis]|uniref:Uncharacterized protein n=1 Tax=Dryococelus australis TaxID=614101 RepID=A0ABQ9GSS2_9NEOP|nr:hypothetical protein PR048_022958 [Dryococelus australis]